MKRLTDLTPYSSGTHAWLLALRILIAAFMIMAHGLPKLTKVMAGNMAFGNPLGIGSGPSLVLAMLAEVGGSLLLALGFLTRFAALALMFTMFVASIITNWGKPFGEMELPLLYLLVYTTLFFTGPGKYSVDARRLGSRRF